MAARADEASLPDVLLRFLALPAALGALIATAYRRDLPW
jgi:hypothetical protein